MAKPLINVIGSLNVDLISRVKRVPSAGETLHSQSYDTGCGGKGANQAVACARLSRSRPSTEKQGQNAGADVDVSMTGAVGGDGFGQELLSSLSSNGINTSNVRVRKDGKTGVAIIIVEEDTGDNRILLSSNANFTLLPDQFSSFPSLLSAAGDGGPRKPDLIVLQLEIPLYTTLSILRTAGADDVPTLVNPAPAQVLPKEAYEAITHLIVNESEAALITETPSTVSSTGADPVANKPNSNGEGDNILKECVRRLSRLPVPHITITLGAQGVIYLDNRPVNGNSADKKLQRLPAEKVQVRDTTAAGDTFVGAYAVGVVSLLRGPRPGKVEAKAEPEARKGELTFEAMAGVVRWANKAASLTVERDGAQKSIPWKEEVESATTATGDHGQDGKGGGGGKTWSLTSWLEA